MKGFNSATISALSAVFLSYTSAVLARENRSPSHIQTDPRSLAGDQFCRSPDQNNKQLLQELDLCKLREEDETWYALTEGQNREIPVRHRLYSNECGPHCRPSCITLMLDLDELDISTDLICEEDKLCNCEFSKGGNYECSDQDYQDLIEAHPKCYLEGSDCLGPTVYDDHAAYAKTYVDVPELKHCTALPSEKSLYCRFQDFPVVTPIEGFDKCDHGCFDDSKIYFEYCNIVGEDQQCDHCDNKNCGQRCKKVTEPFPNGWTTFVVSGSIPYSQGRNDKCDNVLEYEGESRAACFLQRVEIFYPPNDLETCDDQYDCPICHDCPLLSLGDKFGPLEVVGFGHCIDHECAGCDSRDKKECGKCDGRCNDIFDCDALVDCNTEQSLFVPDFGDNMCSFT